MKIKCNLDVFTFQYPYHKELKTEVLKYLDGYPDVQCKTTNVKALMTDWNITTPQIEKLKDFCLSNLIFFDPSIKVNCVEFKDFWANIYSKGDYTKPHIHGPYAFSFVYFLSSKLHHSPLVFCDSNKRIRPKEGNFLIFSSAIKHEVPKHNFEEKRITLAGNISIK